MGQINVSEKEAASGIATHVLEPSLISGLLQICCE